MREDREGYCLYVHKERKRYFHNRAGNRIRRISGGVEEQYQYDAGNRLTALTQNGVTIPFQYDAAGNLLRDDRAEYTYDRFNRTIRVETFDGHIQINRYDAEGLRAEMEENGKLVQFIFNPEREVVTETGEERLRYIRGHELLASDAESTRTYYHYASDELGSITHVVDEAGEVVNRYVYDAWGNVVEAKEGVPNRFAYAGEQLDPITQQYYLRARYYNPVIARFIQEDTYRGDGLNLYAYCQNNPVYYVDSSGHSAECGRKKSMDAEGTQEKKGEAYKKAKPESSKEKENDLPKAPEKPEVDPADNRPMAPEVSTLYGNGVGEGGATDTELKEIFNSIRESPNYPEGFQARPNGTRNHKINNQPLLEKLRKIESGTWKKVYKDGYDANGNKISIHYFQSPSGKVFNVKVKKGWSNK